MPPGRTLGDDPKSSSHRVEMRGGPNDHTRAPVSSRTAHMCSPVVVSVPTEHDAVPKNTRLALRSTAGDDQTPAQPSPVPDPLVNKSAPVYAARASGSNFHLGLNAKLPLSFFRVIAMTPVRPTLASLWTSTPTMTSTP